MTNPKVIVATDLSDNAGAAAKWALAYARKAECSLVVVHVLDITLRSWKGAYNVLEDTKIRDRAHERIRSWFEEHTGEQPDEVMLEAGSAFVRLTDVARQDDAHMLVISLSGKGAWNKFVFGSTALKLAHSPPCPLVVVHPNHTEIWEDFKVAMGTDFSDTSDAAAPMTAALARKLNAHLDIVHANVLPSTTVITEEDLPEELQSTQVHNWARQAMEDFVTRHGDDLEGVDYHCHIITDYPTRGLIRFVEANDINLLVLGHYGRDAGPVGRLSSVMIKAVQQMRCTTLVVPQDQGLGARG